VLKLFKHQAEYLNKTGTMTRRNKDAHQGLCGTRKRDRLCRVPLVKASVILQVEILLHNGSCERIKKESASCHHKHPIHSL
jgi:hypothetical protein